MAFAYSIFSERWPQLSGAFIIIDLAHDHTVNRYATILSNKIKGN